MFILARPFRLAILLLSVWLVGCGAPHSSHAADTLQTFPLRDQLGHDWHNELVTYPVADTLFGRQDVALIGPADQAVAFQWETAENGAKKIAFLADLPANGHSDYRLQTGAAKIATDLTIEESAGEIRIFNARTGVSIRKKLGDNQGPISGIKLNSGAWVGGSRLESALPLQKYEARVVANGPVFAEVLCTATFGGGKSWRMRLRAIAGEPVVLVSENSDLGDQSAWRLNLNENFAPTRILSRFGMGAGNSVGQLYSETLATTDGELFVLEPWLHWWQQKNQYSWLGLYGDNGEDLLALAALHPARWAAPNAKTPQAPARVEIRRAGATIVADFSLTGGARQWLLGALGKTQSLQPLAQTTEKIPLLAALPQQYLVKYGDFPLDEIKDYPSQWPSDDDGHPRLLVTREQVARFRQNYKADEKLKATLLKSTRAYDEAAIDYYLGTGDKAVGRLLADAAISGIQNEVDQFFAQNRYITLGFAPHQRRGLLNSLALADVVWSDILTPAERARLRAQIAFLGATVNRPDYWSPERGFAGNPNMTTMVATYQTAYGAMIPAHPDAKTWAANGIKELKRELDEWSDEKGGWLEAPHYAMASYDYILGGFLMAHNAGMNDYIYDPKLKSVARWFAEISTPPDIHLQGLRHLPPLGNTYMNEPTNEFGLLAGIWKERDPQFAAEMQWMYRQQGAYKEVGVGGKWPALDGFRPFLFDATIVPRKPDYGSIWFPKTGVMLRNGVDDRETQLHLIAGSNHAHYDDDSGSITLWGKGRLIANDFGYNGAAPADQHSMIDSPAARGVMQIKSFVTQPQFDYLRGVAGSWNRQIIFVKDADPMAPNYFVLRDALPPTAPAIWRLFLDADKVTAGRNTLVEGKDDVDTDIIFAAPDDLSLKTESKTVTVYGLDENLKYGKVATTQTGLVTDIKGGDILAVIYPRLKTAKPPVVTSLAGGKAVKVQHETGTDYVFLSETPFEFQGDGIAFSGTSGLVKIRAGKALVALGEGGTLTALGQSAAGETPPFVEQLASKEGKVVWVDFEDGNLDGFPQSALNPQIFEGHPVAGDASNGVNSLLLTVPPGGSGNLSYKKPIFVDASRKYRLSARVFSPRQSQVFVGGYGATRDGQQLKNERGGAWSWRTNYEGPTDGWKTIETTFGPPNSGAANILSPDVAALRLVIWATGAGAPIYLDDLSVEEIK